MPDTPDTLTLASVPLANGDSIVAIPAPCVAEPAPAPEDRSFVVWTPAGDTTITAPALTCVDPETAWERPTFMGEPRRRKDAKDWAPLRALAQKRARIQLTTVWEDAAKGQRISRVDYRRFCYRDYSRKHQSLAVIEQPYSLSLRLDGLDDGKKLILSHYCISVKGGRLAFYCRHGSGPKATIRHSSPEQLKLMSPVGGSYPAVEARFSKRLTRMLRSKARANGVKLPKGDDLKAVLTAALWPGLGAVKARHQEVFGAAWTPGQDDRWLMRHFRCEPADLPRKVTGYGSKAVKRLFWAAMCPSPSLAAGSPPWSRPAERLWQHKWSWCALIRTWFPVDLTQTLLRAPKIAAWDDSFTKDPAAVRRFLKQWTPAQVLRALTDTCADNSTIRDTLRMAATRAQAVPPLPPLQRTNGPAQLHDLLVAEAVRIRQQEQREREARRLAAMTPEARADYERREAARNAAETEPFSYSERVTLQLAEIHCRTVITASDAKVHTLFVPTDARQMNAMGTAMHNCIGGYAHYVRLGECLILGVRTEGSDKVCDWGIELRRRTIVQFRGVCNVEPSLELKAAVERALLAADLIEQLTVGELNATFEDGAYEALAQVAQQEVAA